MTKFSFKKLICILVLFITPLIVFPQSENDNRSDKAALSNQKLIVQTKYGYVKGKKDKNNTIVWKGIPFAKPPVGDLRWKAPVEPIPWEGILKTQKFSNAALQYHSAFKKKIFGNEDCLYLNIWKPETNKTKLPVYVWIHGGGNSLGYANQLSEYYGQEIADKSELIFVSVNYRLGPFGWLTHPALRKSDNPIDNSGNYGTLDIIQALKWIQENIQAFGGDPERVMIAGESAGGINVLSLMISPQAKGLFSAALCQSGIPKTGNIKDSEELTEKIISDLLIENKIADNIQDAKKKLNTMSHSEIRDFLYKQDGKDIMRTVSPHLMGMIDMPYIFPDGYVIPKTGYAVLETGDQVNKVPLMIGCNTNEMKLFLYFSDEPNWKDTIFSIAAKYTSDMWKAKGVDNIARKLSELPDQPPVYVYLFNYGNPDDEQNSPLKGKWGKKLGAHHMSEIKFFLGTDKHRFALLSLLNRNSYKEGRDDLTNAMMTYAKNLLYFGNPNQKENNLPEWSAWNNNNETKGLILDAGKTKAIIKNLNDEFYPDSIVKEMNNRLTKKQLELVNNFMFIFK